MWADQQQDVVFIETVSNLSRGYHTVIHCIPIEGEAAEFAPMIFKVCVRLRVRVMTLACNMTISRIESHFGE